MLCEITRKLDSDDLEKIQALEKDLGFTLVAFSCRSMDPDREAKLQKIMDELGPVLQAPVAGPSESQLGRIQALEDDLGLALVAVTAMA